MDARKPLDRTAVVLMLVLCAVWALQQIGLKASAVDIDPVLQIGLRSGGAALLVGLLMLWRGERMSVRDGTWRAGSVVGVLFGLEFLLVGEGLRHTSAAHMVVFLYTAPIFAALGLHWRLPAERLAPLQWLGIALAFGGIVLAFLGRGQGPADAVASTIRGDFLGLMGGLAWGATTVVVRCSGLARAPATQTLLYQLTGAFLLLMGVALADGQVRFNPTPWVWASLAFQVLVVSFASYLLWFWLLRTYLASRLGAFSFLTPLLGVVFGAALLDERIETAFVLAVVPVSVGIVLVSAHGWVARVSGALARRWMTAAAMPNSGAG